MTTMLLELCLCLLCFGGLADVLASPAQTRQLEVRQIQTPFSDAMIKRQQERAQLSDIQGLLRIVEFRADMTILDIGAGTGQYAYVFAKQLNDTGQVFATDIDPQMINYVNREARKQGLSNLHGVLVGRDGVDEFYRRHRFDIVFLAHVYGYMNRRILFMKELRNYIADRGHLVIVRTDISPFSLTINDSKDFVEELSRLPPTDFFCSRLSDKTRGLLRSSSDVRLIARSAVRDFNATLSDETFFRHFVQDGRIVEALFTPRERRFAQNLLDYRQKEVLFTRVPPTVSNVNKIPVCLNKLLFEQRFRKYLRSNTAAMSQTMIKEMAAAGFRFEQNYDFAPMEFAAIFKKVE